MKIKNITLSAVAMLLGASMLAPSALAAAPYGMEYSGGEPLDDSNVTIDPELINSLTPLITGSGNTVSFSDSAQWKDAWLDDGYWDYDRDEYIPNCVATKYLLYGGDFDNDNGDVYFTVSNDSYSVRVQVDDIMTTIPWIDADNLGGLSFNLSYNVDTGGQISFMDASGSMFSDSSCGNPIHLAGPDGGGRVYVQTKLKLSKNNGEPFYSDELFLGVDLDLERSFMVLNSDNLLTKSNMYAKSTYALQPYNGASKYVDSNKYIYSYDPDIGPDISYSSDPDVFVKISQGAQDDGIDVVHGFSHSFPYSNILFYAREYTVTYTADENGDITGITSEEVFSGHNPAGSMAAPKEDYEFAYWTADKEVELKNGTTITPGEHISAEQVKEVVVHDDVSFEAHFEKKAAPDPGPGPGPEPQPDPEPEPEPKPEPEPEPEVEPEEEEPEIPVPNTSSPDTGAYTNDAGFITLGLAGSIVAGITLALVGLAIKSKRN